MTTRKVVSSALLLFLLLAARFGATPSLARATASGDRPDVTSDAESTVVDERRARTGDLFDDLESLEDPQLESHTAGDDLTTTEIVVVVIFLVLLFPVGVILLIIFLVDE